MNKWWGGGRILTAYLSIIMDSKAYTFLTSLHCYLLVSRRIFLHLPLLERLWRESSHTPFHVVQQIRMGGLLSLVITAYSERSRYLEIGPITRALQSIASAGQQSPSYPCNMSFDNTHNTSWDTHQLHWWEGPITWMNGLCLPFQNI